MFGSIGNLISRDQRIISMMKLGRPVRIIAALEGIEHDYARKLCMRLAKEEGLDYAPDNKLVRAETPPVGITDSSRSTRRFLADKLCLLGTDYQDIAKQVGITLRSQKYARQRPFNHDWTMSQIERLAAALNTDFLSLMQEASNAGVFQDRTKV